MLGMHKTNSLNTGCLYYQLVVSMSEPDLWELKEKAKWSPDLVEKKNAISGLSRHGEGAISALEEILAVTAYDDIKSACIEAIKSVRESKGAESANEKVIPSDDAKKKYEQAAEYKIRKTESRAEEGKVRLADLPP
jgi:hypothetical protein